MSEVFTETERYELARSDFHKGLLSAVYGLKAYINSVKEDFKSLKMKQQQPQAQAVVRESIEKKRLEIGQLIQQMKEMFGGVGRELRQEAARERDEMADMRGELQETMGFEDSVKGFDLDMVTDDNIDFLDIYAEFLGEEYLKMKENF